MENNSKHRTTMTDTKKLKNTFYLSSEELVEFMNKTVSSDFEIECSEDGTFWRVKEKR